MLRQGPRQATHRFVMSQVNRLIVLMVLLPAIPNPHQRMLKYGQLIDVITDFIQELIDQPSTDLSTADGNRAFDGITSLIARSTGNQVFAVIDRFRQTG